MGAVIHQAVAVYNGDGGVVFVIRKPDGSFEVRMYSTGAAGPTTGGCRLLFSTPLTTVPAANPPSGQAWEQSVANALRNSSVVVADQPRALAVDTGGGDWLLVNTATGAIVMATAVGNVIGVGDLGDHFFDRHQRR